jgi:hypothetical protein
MLANLDHCSFPGTPRTLGRTWFRLLENFLTMETENRRREKTDGALPAGPGGDEFGTYEYACQSVILERESTETSLAARSDTRSRRRLKAPGAFAAATRDQAQERHIGDPRAWTCPGVRKQTAERQMEELRGGPRFAVQSGSIRTMSEPVPKEPSRGMGRLFQLRLHLSRESD